MPSGRGNPFRASGPFAPAGRGKRAEKGACDFTDECEEAPRCSVAYDATSPRTMPVWDGRSSAFRVSLPITPMG